MSWTTYQWGKVEVVKMIQSTRCFRHLKGQAFEILRALIAHYICRHYLRREDDGRITDQVEFRPDKTIEWIIQNFGGSCHICGAVRYTDYQRHHPDLTSEERSFFWADPNYRFEICATCGTDYEIFVLRRHMLRYLRESEIGAQILGLMYLSWRLDPSKEHVRHLATATNRIRRQTDRYKRFEYESELLKAEQDASSYAHLAQEAASRRQTLLKKIAALS